MGLMKLAWMVFESRFGFLDRHPISFITFIINTN